jgi:WD40 repeat protein
MSSFQPERRIALVIGNAKYKAGLLANSTRDAEAVARRLSELGFELVDGGPQLNLDQDGFKTALESFGTQIRGRNVALFYYSGHGIQLDGRNYLVPVDVPPRDPTSVIFRMINIADVLHLVERSDRLNILVLDACGNNPWSAVSGHRSVAEGLAELPPPTGTLISFAALPGHVALDGKEGGHSPFTEALLEALNEKPDLSLLNFFDLVGERVQRKTDRYQIPWLRSSSLGDGREFRFLPRPPEPLSEEAVLNFEALERWQAVKLTAEPEKLRAFLDGSTRSAKLARDRLVELERAAWERLPTPRTVDALQAFLVGFPNGANAVTAEVELAALRRAAEEEQAFKAEAARRRRDGKPVAEERKAEDTADTRARSRQEDDEKRAAELQRQHNDPVAQKLPANIRRSRRGVLILGATVVAGVGVTIGKNLVGPQSTSQVATPTESRTRRANDPVRLDNKPTAANKSQRLIRTFEGIPAGISSVAFSPDGRTVLSGGETLKLWDVTTGNGIREFALESADAGIVDDLLGQRGPPIWVVAFSPNGSTACSGGKFLLLWDTETGTIKRRFLSQYITSVDISPDGRKVLSGSDRGTIELRDANSEDLSNATIRLSDFSFDTINSLKFSADGKTALSGQRFGTLTLWDITTGKMIREFMGQGRQVRSVAFSPDGRTALSGGDDGTLRLWDIAEGNVIREFEHKSSTKPEYDSGKMVISVAFSPDGKTALSGSIGEGLKLWDIAAGDITRVIDTGINSNVAFSPDRKMAVTYSLIPFKLDLWDLT